MGGWPEGSLGEAVVVPGAPCRRSAGADLSSSAVIVRISGSLAGMVVARRGFGVAAFLSSQPIRKTRATIDMKHMDRDIRRFLFRWIAALSRNRAPASIPSSRDIDFPHC